MDDNRLLVERARTDPHAFGLLFDRHHDDIYKYILHRTANAELARDLTSETFYKALNKLWTFRWQNVPFLAWLYRIASNEVNGFYRKHKNYKNVPLEDIMENSGSEYRHLKEELEGAKEEINNNLLFMELQQAVSCLGNKYQEVVTLRFFEHKKVKEVAEILNKSEGTVKSLLHRALKQLKEIMEAPPKEGESL
ncbi:MAG: sigma-70 family RNA polymerase sigma factor [bacterium]|nr:sigma-70 family RNA polymerase sigma factor [bacterium]